MVHITLDTIFFMFFFLKISKTDENFKFIENVRQTLSEQFSKEIIFHICVSSHFEMKNSSFNFRLMNQVFILITTFLAFFLL